MARERSDIARALRARPELRENPRPARPRRSISKNSRSHFLQLQAGRRSSWWQTASRHAQPARDGQPHVTSSAQRLAVWPAPTNGEPLGATAHAS